MIIVIKKKGGIRLKKYSRQRELILQSLQERTDHPTAESLYWDLKKVCPSIGIATVYRNLVELCAEKKVLKIKTEEGIDRFDGNILPHPHFICENCHEVQDIFLSEEEIQELDSKMKQYAETIEASLGETQIAMKGLCKQCRIKKEEENNESICM